MASLTNTKIKDTYDGLLKTTDNAALGGTYKLITDGLGNSSGVYLGTGGNVGIGTANPSVKLSIRNESSSHKIFSITRPASDVPALYLGNQQNNGVIASNFSDLIFGRDFSGTFTENMRITNGGNVGILTSDPNNVLHVKTSTNGEGLTLQINSTTEGAYSQLSFVPSTAENTAAPIYIRGFRGSNLAASYLTLNTNSSERMRIDSSGVVQIRNVSSPTLQLFNTDTALTSNQVVGEIEFYQSDPSGGGVGVVSKIRSINISSFQGEGALTFETGTTSSLTERMRIQSGGTVLVGKTSSAANTVGCELNPIGLAQLTRDGNLPLLVNRKTSDGTIVSIRKDNVQKGSISVSGSTTSYNTTSDYRLKENVVDMTGALDRIEQLQPKRFNFISDAETTVDGFIAHEVQSVIPEAVFGEKDAVDDEGNPEYQGIDQSKIVPLLVGAIKELKAEIETLKSQINS